MSFTCVWGPCIHPLDPTEASGLGVQIPCAAGGCLSPAVRLWTPWLTNVSTNTLAQSFILRQ